MHEPRSIKVNVRATLNAIVRSGETKGLLVNSSSKQVEKYMKMVKEPMSEEVIWAGPFSQNTADGNEVMRASKSSCEEVPATRRETVNRPDSSMATRDFLRKRDVLIRMDSNTEEVEEAYKYYEKAVSKDRHKAMLEKIGCTAIRHATLQVVIICV